jgi:phage head maturation protease
MTNNREHKTSPALLVKAEESGIVEAIVSVFGVIDGGNDVIHPGSFTKTITERTRKIRVVDQHNTNSVRDVLGIVLELREIGRNELPPELLQKFPSATGGLYTKTQYLMDTPEGLGAFTRIKSGAIDEYSIGYEALDVDYARVKNDAGSDIRVRNLRTIKLWEYSPVIWGMNPATATVGVKNEGDNMTEPAVEPTKENTPSGPIKRLGDSLYARAMSTFNNEVTWMLGGGYIDQDQWTLLTDGFRAQMDAFIASVPEDLALMPLDNYWMLAGNDPAESKAGRILSAANASRIKAALEALTDVLKEAGLDEAAAAVEDETPKSQDPTEPEDTSAAGSDLPPTAEKSIELQRKALALRVLALDI